MTYLKLIIALLPVVLEIIREIQRRRLTAEATQEVINDLHANADAMVTRALAARNAVTHDADSVSKDPFNRDDD